MLLLASQTIGLPVAAMDTQAKIGTIKTLIINPEDGKLAGIIVATGAIFSKDQVLAATDIIEFDKTGIVTKSEENLVDIKEIVRIDNLLKKKIPIIGQKAITKAKKYLGKINDFLVDSELLAVAKFYVHSLLNEKILPAEKVVEITSQAVVFSDDVAEEIPGSSVEEATA